MYKSIEECKIISGAEAKEQFPQLSTYGLKLLIDKQEKRVLFYFSEDWEDDQIWAALRFANQAVDELIFNKYHHFPKSQKH